MDIYSNYELNRVANEIRDELEELGQSMGAMMGQSTGIDPNKAQMIIAKVNSMPNLFATELLSRNQKKLNVIEASVGSNDEVFEELSDILAMSVVGIIRFPINYAKLMTMASDFKNSLNTSEMIKIKRNITESIWTLDNLSQLKVSPNVKFQISNLKETAKVLDKKFNPSSGCYIATYVYGDYDAPEVIKLRLFRDSFLIKYWAGKHFVNLYYFISPKIISGFGNNKLFKNVSKRFLDRIIIYLEK